MPPKRRPFPSQTNIRPAGGRYKEPNPARLKSTLPTQRRQCCFTALDDDSDSDLEANEEAEVRRFCAGWNESDSDSFWPGDEEGQFDEDVVLFHALYNCPAWRRILEQELEEIQASETLQGQEQSTREKIMCEQGQVRKRMVQGEARTR